jgi:hypothetical protein
MTYKDVQTGAKIQLGGLKLGFTKVGYQVVIEARVTIPETYPTTKQITTTIAIRETLFIFFYLESNLLKTFYSIAKINPKPIQQKKYLC